MQLAHLRSPLVEKNETTATEQNSNKSDTLPSTPIRSDLRLVKDKLHSTFLGVVTYSNVSRKLRPFVKRSMDIVGAATLMVLLSPFFALIVCLVARDGGSIIYASIRVGRAGQEFRCLKFRTMVPDATLMLADLLRTDDATRAEWELTCKLRNDPRVTPIGRVLRALSIDELPQLLNVLMGSMSLVGPRPVPWAELQKYYGGHVRDYISVRPGLTGPWQVGGRSDASYDRRVAFDVAYARNPSIRTDLRTLLQTVSAVVLCRGAR